MTLSLKRIRENILNNGGVYMPAASRLSNYEAYDFFKMLKDNSNIGNELYAFAGKEAIINLQEIAKNPIMVLPKLSIEQGMLSANFPFCFSAGVDAFKITFYRNHNAIYDNPIEVTFVHLAILDQPDTLNNHNSAITGKPILSSSIWAVSLPKNTNGVKMEIVFNDGLLHDDVVGELSYSSNVAWGNCGLIELAA